MVQAVEIKWMSLPPAPPALVHLSIHHTFVRSDRDSELIQLFAKRKHYDYPVRSACPMRKQVILGLSDQAALNPHLSHSITGSYD